MNEDSRNPMQKFAFICILLMTGLFSLQLQLKHNSSSFYEEEKIAEELEVQQVDLERGWELDKDHYLFVDTTGKAHLLKRKRLISL